MNCDCGISCSHIHSFLLHTVKPVLHEAVTQKEYLKLVFKTDFCFMQVKSYHLSFRPLFCLFLSGSLQQVLPYPNTFCLHSQL